MYENQATFYTYGEPHLRFVVLRNTILPPSHTAEYVLRGQNPFERWELIYSYMELDDAIEACQERQADAPFYEFYRVVDCATVEGAKYFAEQGGLNKDG